MGPQTIKKAASKAAFLMVSLAFGHGCSKRSLKIESLNTS